MDRDTIIRLAREAGFADGVVDIVGAEGFANFAALVAVQVEATWQNRYLKLMDLMEAREGQPNKPCCLAEREACAKVCDDWPNGRDDVYSIGVAIRARGQA